MALIEALIFDVDGTLAETEELHRLAFNASFAAAGLTWVWDRARYGQLLEVTGGKERMKHFVAQYGGAPALDGAQIAALHADKTARYTAMVEAGELRLRPGIERLLAEAKAAGLKLAIATTTSRANVDALLLATLGTQPFDVIAAGDEVAAKKPAPDVYRLAVDGLGVSAAACIAFEDTANGLRSAIGAGVACLMTVSGFGGNGPFPGALAVVDHLGDPGNAASVMAGPPLAGQVVDIAALEALLAVPKPAPAPP